MAVEKGHEVTALVRPESAYAPPSGVVVERGSALDTAAVSRLLAGRDAVISCVGPQRTHPRNPWSPLRPPPGVAELSTRAVLAGLGDDRARRFAAISAAGVGESLSATNGMMRWLIRHSSIGAMYADLEAMENVLGRSGIDWIAVRPVTLVSARPSSRARVLDRFRARSLIGRADVAGWLVRAVADPGPIENRTPMIGWW